MGGIVSIVTSYITDAYARPGGAVGGGAANTFSIIYTGNLIVDTTGLLPYKAPNNLLSSNVQTRGNVLNTMYFTNNSNTLVYSSSSLEYTGNIGVEMWVYPTAYKDAVLFLLEGKKPWPQVSKGNCQSIIVKLLVPTSPYWNSNIDGAITGNFLHLSVWSSNVYADGQVSQWYQPWGYNFNTAKYPKQKLYVNTWNKVTLTYTGLSDQTSFACLANANIAVSVPDLRNYAFVRSNTFSNIYIGGGDGSEEIKAANWNAVYDRFNGYISDVLISNGDKRANTDYDLNLVDNPNVLRSPADDFVAYGNTLAYIKTFNNQGISTYPNITSANIGFAFNMNSGNAGYNLDAITNRNDTSPNRWNPLNAGSRGSSNIFLPLGGPYYDGNVYFWQDGNQNASGINTLSGAQPNPFSWHWSNNFINKDYSIEFNLIRKNDSTAAVPSALDYSSADIIYATVGSIKIYRKQYTFANNSTLDNYFVLQITISPPSNYASGTFYESNQFSLPPPNVWAHYVITRNFDTSSNLSRYRLYVDGVIKANVATLSSHANYDIILDPSDGLHVAGQSAGNGTFSYGIDNMRLIKGNPWPVDGFTKPTRPWLA